MKHANKTGSGRPETRLRDVDLGQTMGRDDYEKALKKLQRKLAVVQQAYLVRGHAAAIVFEGWDASGKGGTIRRMSAALDPRGFKVWPIGAPRPYYLNRHFLLRFMERMPPSGGISVFDRSWYGRVLVERVEDLTPEDRWRAAYREISDFERMMTDDGIRIVKLFLHVSPEEQLARFEDRLRDPMKRWKLSYEDFRNRARWSEYETAIDEMFAETSTKSAPWVAIAANCKRHARITAIREIVDRLSEGVDLSAAPLDESVLRAARDHFDLSPGALERMVGRTE